MNIMEKAFQGISMPTFYKLGSILFGFGLIGAGINAKMQWVTLNLGGKISMTVAFFFQCLLLTLFLTLYMQTKKAGNSAVVNSPDIDNFLNELKNEDTKTSVKGGLKND